MSVESSVERTDRKKKEERAKEKKGPVVVQPVAHQIAPGLSLSLSLSRSLSLSLSLSESKERRYWKRSSKDKGGKNEGEKQTLGICWVQVRRGEGIDRRGCRMKAEGEGRVERGTLFAEQSR